jgi:uncharacterized membrane protein
MQRNSFKMWHFWSGLALLAWPVVFACQLSISVRLQMSPLVLFVDLWVQRQERSTTADKLLVFLLLCPHQLTSPSTTYLL